MDEAYRAMQMILAGETEDVQIGAFLMLLRVKEESCEELAGFVQAARDHIKAPSSLPIDLDWSSYAGKKKQLPWFLLSCFLLADNGIRIYMHGAAGHTQGRLYTEQALQQLDIPIAHNWQQVEQQLDKTNFSFMPLSNLCPQLNDIILLRDQLGLRSPVHTLSRLLNPLAAKFSMQSIFHPSYADSHQQAALLLGQENAAVFKGEGGEIERKPEAICLVKSVTNGQCEEENWPKFVDGRQTQAESLDIQHLIDTWNGSIQDSYGQQAIIGTAAIALKLLNKANSQTEAIALAEDFWQRRNKQRLG
jgi:anthranilate phosphoribosyltransferase